MRRSIVPFVLLLTLLLTACASSDAQKAGGAAKPQIHLRELTGPRQSLQPRGPIEIQYEIVVANRASHGITLRRVELVSVGTGPYQLRPDFYTFNRVIEANGSAAVTFWAKAYLYATSSDLTSSEPVTIRAVATFDSPNGAFQQVLMKSLSQYPE